MDFRVNEDQQALRDGIREFCAGRVPLERLPELEKQQGFDRALWGELAEMGVFDLRLPESEGGVGLGASEAVLVFAELGRQLAPGPLAWSHLAAGRIEGAAEGNTVVGGLDLAGALTEPLLLEHLASLDALLVLRPDGAYRIDPRGLDAQPVGVPLDPLTPLHQVASLPEGERIADAASAARLRLEGSVLVAGQLFGIAERTLELAVDYAVKREQFDRPIGGFQALKHIMADMLVRVEAARAAVYAAGATLDQPDVGDLERAVSSARVMAGEAALRNARACIQIYGGMGYTWEMPPHYFLKRTWVLGTCFGTGEEHEERVAARVEASL
ncbi:MAG: acyl-CoA dehydrogenase family protein [Myxococcota bacterium]|nr:acyl-CoA dehydrogenase family protein [Myxococcota bacterium]